ncbi:fibronectin type III domain-containing protein [Nocardiopsis changdeensis]|uniref:Fibronectin type III domain-containing protein n=1 Tax=Nocardiopsis changdeensis TaxID=2831969 RepID=A0ABX8BDH9_9ACTN|nr:MULTISPECIES: fibronectin type III domain-containing protein [Nocardiopsis]QUX20300.1 fibronectin type III domain-containing protein [Nocardiopsis changdeensis]QYX36230.1 fibronectin type III domain-containing protein [Nocardiopsis sp. MT53]
MDAAAQHAIDDLTRMILRLQSQVDTLQRGGRGGQLAHSSLEEGQAVEVRDETGAVRLRFGYQPDGRAAVVTEGGEPVTAPTAPTVTPMPSGLRVSWDGALADDSALPSDFDHVNVHVSTEDGFTPSEATFVVTIPRSAGAVPIAPLTVGTTYYVCLVPVTTGGIVGDPSAQASGVPAAVTDIAPGSITETEIADDAISTPKLRAEAVTALKIAAEAIEAGHIKAAAVTASKLEAELVLGTRIIAGTPSGARVELDSTGIKGYNAADELVFVVDDTGTALFSGDIVASEISGSRMVVGTAPGPTGVIEGDANVVTQRVRVGNMTAQLVASSASNQSAFTATSDATSPSSPLAGFAATSGAVSFAIDSSASTADGLPSITGLANSTLSQLAVWSKRNDVAEPMATLTATTTETSGAWTSPGGGQVRLVADSGSASVRLSGPSAATNSFKWGRVYGIDGASGTRALSLRSPNADADNLRSTIVLEGASPSRTSSRAIIYARELVLTNEIDGDALASGTAQVRLVSGVYLNAPAHAPVRTDMVSWPASLAAAGSWHAFPSGNYPAVNFTTGPSGRVRITITAALGNNTGTTTTIHIGAALSGASSVSAAVGRAWTARGVLMQSCSRVLYLDLVPNGTYTLTPSYNYSSGTVNVYTTFEHSIVAEPLP